MDIIRNLVPLLPAILPFVGKALLMLPFVPNKAIPLINVVIATTAKYWYLAGFGVLGDPSTAPPGSPAAPDSILMGSVLGGIGSSALAIVWGCLDTAAAHYFYEGRRAIAAKVGKTSWWEQGKASIYK